MADSPEGTLRHRVAQGIRDSRNCMDSGDDRGTVVADGARAAIVFYPSA